MEKIKLGSKVKCVVTGFKGVAVSRVEFLNGCIQYCIKPKQGKDGKYPEGEFVDEAQVEVINDGLNIKKKKTGGVMPDTPKC